MCRPSFRFLCLDLCILGFELHVLAEALYIFIYFSPVGFVFSVVGKRFAGNECLQNDLFCVECDVKLGAAFSKVPRKTLGKFLILLLLLLLLLHSFLLLR